MELSQEILELIKSDEVLEPETLRQIHPELSEEDFNQIMALKTLRISRGFWENFYVFEAMVHALNKRVPTPQTMQGATPEEIWYALEMVHKMYPDREYSIEVLKYIEYNMKDMGVYIFPPYLDLPNPYYSKAVHLATVGPFPLGESIEEIQAAKYLAIETYINNKGQEK